MSGLVAYASSDDEDGTPVIQVTKTLLAMAKSSRKVEEKPLAGPAPGPSAAPGPSLPPADDPSPPEPTIDMSQAPGSPYTTSRTIIHDLTLPSIPNVDIQASPPGSPPPGANKKFEQFILLKKQGVHFNAKLENSEALRNPSLMDKLLGFVGVEGKEQYETTLRDGWWDPKAFPREAYRRTLRKNQEKITREREADKAAGNRTSVDFVPSTTTGGNTSTTTEGHTSNVGGITTKGAGRKRGWD
ncbi:HCNGP-like protein-domain-containing protein [Emericellopsis atlantica]|uniref:HCNGP-like protein-domain-containing protein n=1 Tax=Emericellopsis atlantica TaxID=2614577 RepID=A0A9P8CLQ1_9HYPO|nr:HCNGP-like protein-domain-containing protein [Emericellopsis atlantica]KAG9249841.1 HCNGP-like protein-domain-containing protein [Emericellopsis atlantica]